jgi:hypothetical protein
MRNDPHLWACNDCGVRFDPNANDVRYNKFCVTIVTEGGDVDTNELRKQVVRALTYANSEEGLTQEDEPGVTTAIIATNMERSDEDDDCYHLWEEVVNRMGWNEESQLIHLEEFIRSLGLISDLADYADEIATEEEANDPWKEN